MNMSIRPFLPTGGKITPIQMLIFIQLLEGPKYGYEILKNLRDDFNSVWNPKTGTLYPALKTLVKKGFISEKEEKETTYYSLTKEGSDFLSDTSELVKDYENGFLFDTRTGKTYSLNRTGTFLLRDLIDGIPTDQLLARLVERFDVDQNTAVNDIDQFLFRLKDLQITEYEEGY